MKALKSGWNRGCISICLDALGGFPRVQSTHETYYQAYSDCTAGGPNPVLVLLRFGYV